MATYAIGDIQGCFEPLQRLLDKLRFNPEQDTLWLTGDLVNRGPASLATLRFIKNLGPSAITVLGNHDLTLLALAAGYVKPDKKDTFAEILAADDALLLIDWLRQQPILHHDPQLDFTMVHAGLAPQWDLAQAQACAIELEQVLRGPQCNDFLAQMFGREPRRWSDQLSGIDRLRCITNIFTRIRYCEHDGSLDFNNKEKPGGQAAHLMPWFEVPERRNADLRVIFGHWATLGYYHKNNIIALDSACVWGGCLTALRLDHSMSGVDDYFFVNC